MTTLKGEAMFTEGMAFVRICDLPKNGLTYVVCDGRLWVAATQWGDHKIVGELAREELIKELEKRIPIQQKLRDLSQ